MRRTVLVVAVVALVAWALLATLPVSARVTSATDLQMSADGYDGIAAQPPRVGGRWPYCMQSPKPHCR